MAGSEGCFTAWIAEVAAPGNFLDVPKTIQVRRDSILNENSFVHSAPRSMNLKTSKAEACSKCLIDPRHGSGTGGSESFYEASPVNRPDLIQEDDRIDR